MASKTEQLPAKSRPWGPGESGGGATSKTQKPTKKKGGLYQSDFDAVDKVMHQDHSAWLSADNSGLDRLILLASKQQGEEATRRKAEQEAAAKAAPKRNFKALFRVAAKTVMSVNRFQKTLHDKPIKNVLQSNARLEALEKFKAERKAEAFRKSRLEISRAQHRTPPQSPGVERDEWWREENPRPAPAASSGEPHLESHGAGNGPSRVRGQSGGCLSPVPFAPAVEFRVRSEAEKLAERLRGDGRLLVHASEENRDLNFVVRTAVEQNGLALEYASERLRDDDEIVLAAVQQHGRALQFASGRLRGDRRVALSAVGQTGSSLEFVLGEELRRDRDVVVLALQESGGTALKHAELRSRKTPASWRGAELRSQVVWLDTPPDTPVLSPKSLKTPPMWHTSETS